MIRFAIDLRMWNHSGIGSYLRNLVPTIIKNNPDYNFILYGNRKILIKEPILKKVTNIEIVNFIAPIYSIKEQLYLYQIIKDDIKIFWSPHFNIPVFNFKLKIIVTIHDVFHLHDFKNLTLIQKAYAYFMINHALKSAKLILTVSKFSKKEIIKYCSVGNDSINIIKNSIDKKVFKRIKDKTLLKEFLSQSKLPSQFILYVGNIKPNKNLLNLLKALSKIQKMNLVIAGRIDKNISNDYENILHYIRVNDDLKNRVFFTGFVSQAEISYLYNLATVFVFPSTYEGFGIPPLEAMGCGCPVIASGIPAIVETCEDAALYFDPYDINDIRFKIMSLIENKNLQNQMIKKGLSRINNFSWHNSANKLNALIKKLV
tara:strand:+ start:131866 stop:132981 length:1116 start_codon:yes stop_codon:yes gene_type:complete